MKTTKYLDFYKQCMETGYMPNAPGIKDSNGLCTLLGNGVMEVFEPTEDDYEQLKAEGKNTAYWGSEMNFKDALTDSLDYEVCSKFTPLRQTVVLLLAAINGEL